MLKTEKKNRIPVAVVLLLMVSALSAAVVAKYILSAPKPVNIFEQTKNECAGVKWINPIDSLNSVSPVTIEGDLYFAGERVPIEDPEVKERLERELQLNTHWHSNTMMGMKMANRYFGEVEKLLSENGVPSDFKYLALIESGFRNEVSPAGAVGFWQLVKGTAQSLGLQVNNEVDERYNIDKATKAACDYLKDGKEKFGSWTTSAASYNLGRPSMAQRIKDQKSRNFYDMYFNPETSRYIFRMLAMKIIFSNPKQAGFDIETKDLYQPYKYKVVEIDSGIADVADFAAQYNLKYKHIKMVNTWLREASLTNKERKKYLIKIMELD